MSAHIKPKRYSLRKQHRQILARYIAGEIGSRKAGEQLGVDPQRIPRMVNALTRQAVINGDVSINHLIK